MLRLLRSFNYKRIINDINGLGYRYTLKNLIVTMAIYAVVTALVAIALNLDIAFSILMIAATVLFIPGLVHNAYKRKYDKILFSDVSQYIEQMLYSFKNNRKIYKSLQDIMPLFETSPIYADLEELSENILAEGNEAAIKYFDAKYSCNKITTVHGFFLESEKIGGDIDETINLLIDDNAAWKERTEGFRKDRNKWRTSIIGAIIISFALCILMEKMLPAEVGIIENVLVRITSVIVYVAEIMLYSIMDRRLSVSMIGNSASRSERQIIRYYEDFMSHDKTKILKKSLKTSLPILIIAIAVTFILKNTFVSIAAFVLAALVFFRPMISYRSHVRILKEEIRIQFPSWLMSMAMLAQSNSIQVALYKSIFCAPVVLKPELTTLCNALTDDPDSARPYHNFMKGFDMPDITASMKMFYAISSGAGADAKKQISDIIKRTNMMVDKAERHANDNFIAGLYSLFLAPQVVGGAKLMVDMVVFLVMFAGSAATLY